jgi:hypothetical protein
MHINVKKIVPLMKDLYYTAKQNLGFKPDVSISLIRNKINAENPLGKTAHYDPQNFKIGLYTDGRHIKDILRSFSHELVHHAQNCRGEFDNGATTVQGYAQEDGHLRGCEREAYEKGNMIFRDWEDNLKKKGGKPLFTSTHYAPPQALDIVSGGFFMEGEKPMGYKINESALRNIIRGVLEEMASEEIDEDQEVVTDAPVQEEQVEDLEEDKKEDLEEDKKELEEDKKEDLEEDKKELDEDDDAKDVKESFFPKGRSIRNKARLGLNEELLRRWKYMIKK